MRLVGDIDELRQSHRVLSGPDGWMDGGAWQVISSRSMAGRTTALTRSESAVAPGPGMEQAPPTFDELVLGYLEEECPEPRAGAGMNCLIWRQHRGQLLWTGLFLVALCVLVALVGLHANHWLTSYDAWLKALRAGGCPLPGQHGSSTVHASCHALMQRYPNGLTGRPS